MRTILPKLKREILADPYYKQCALSGFPRHDCEGRVTWEHAIIYAGKQLNQKWAIVPLCAKAHAVDRFQDAGTMVKDRAVWIALNRATDLELLQVSKGINYHREKDRLNRKYGVYQMPVLQANLAINY